MRLKILLSRKKNYFAKEQKLNISKQNLKQLSLYSPSPVVIVFSSGRVFNSLFIQRGTEFKTRKIEVRLKTKFWIYGVPWSCSLAQMVERQTVDPEVLGSNPAASKSFCTMLQRVTSKRVYKILTKWEYNLDIKIFQYVQ